MSEASVRQRIENRAESAGYSLNNIGVEIGMSYSWASVQLKPQPSKTLRRILMDAPEKAIVVAQMLQYNDVQAMMQDLQLLDGTGLLETKPQNISVLGYATSLEAASNGHKTIAIDFPARYQKYDESTLRSVFVDDSALIAENIRLSSGVHALITSKLPDKLLEDDIALYYVPSLNRAVWCLYQEKVGVYAQSRDPRQGVQLDREEFIFVGLRLATISTRGRDDSL